MWRLPVFFLRLFDYVIHIPHRIWKFVKCFLWIHRFYGKHKFIRWLAGSFLLLLDITPFPLIIETIFDLIKIHTRPFNKHEQELALAVFGKNVPIHLCGMDPVSIPAKKKMTVAFTTLHTVNYDKSISAETFIHEVVHIWQYKKYGSLYISESIWAQRWGGGYNYGGVKALIKNAATGLAAFNFEQQAEIIEDYFRLKNNIPLQWVSAEDDVEVLLEGYVKEVRSIGHRA